MADLSTPDFVLLANAIADVLEQAGEDRFNRFESERQPREVIESTAVYIRRTRWHYAEQLIIELRAQGFDLVKKGA